LFCIREIWPLWIYGTVINNNNNNVSFIHIHCSLIAACNIHAPTEDEIDYVKDSFYKELESVFNKLPKYHISMSKEAGKTFLSDLYF
jgi:hypothetical protein